MEIQPIEGCGDTLEDEALCEQLLPGAEVLHATDIYLHLAYDIAHQTLFLV